MISSCLQTWAFCTLIVLIELGILWFLGHVLYRATRNVEEAVQWRWSSEDSRDMWIDAAKTMISASGIAAALLASLTLAPHQTDKLSPIVASSVKTATVSLVVCVCVSMFLILALARGHEAAKSRQKEKKRPEGCAEKITEGPLSNFALCITLLASFIALSSFFVGFLFLARLVWHI
jgi:hypothetical protein